MLNKNGILTLEGKLLSFANNMLIIIFTDCYSLSKSNAYEVVR